MVQNKHYYRRVILGVFWILLLSCFLLVHSMSAKNYYKDVVQFLKSGNLAEAAHAVEAWQKAEPEAIDTPEMCFIHATMLAKQSILPNCPDDQRLLLMKRSSKWLVKGLELKEGKKS
jgi:hypothetical protein